MLKRACALLGVAPAEALYVGDMPLDVETAARAGMPHLLVPTGAVPADELAGVPGAALARDLLDVVSRVATTGPR
jgi:phosphoglycolate phosphatase-like HAD superfamily hydrolase